MLPDVAAAAARLNVAEAQLKPFYDAAARQQEQDCRLDRLDPATDQDIGEALIRRVANLWASKAHTLGVLDTGLDFGVQYVPSRDPVIDNLERPWRRMTAVG